MKNASKLMIVAAALAAAASAHATPAGDIIVGYTSTSGNDYLFNAGLPSLFTDGETWTIAAPTTSGEVFGAVGFANGSTATTKLTYVTSNPTQVPPPTQNYNAIKSSINSITTPTTVGTSTPVAASSPNSWFTQTDQAAGTPGNYFFNQDLNPNNPVAGAANLYTQDNNNDPATLMGDFTTSADGTTLTWHMAAVPEPSTYGLIAATALLGLSLRRQFTARA